MDITQVRWKAIEGRLAVVSETRMVWLPDGVLIRFDRIHKCDRWTHTQMDTYTYDSISFTETTKVDSPVSGTRSNSPVSFSSL